MGAMGLTKTLGAGYFVSFAGREGVLCLLAVCPSVSCPSAGCVASLGDTSAVSDLGCFVGVSARHVPQWGLCFL